jgi:ribosomal protein S18 acetylase RimI-like enzyme
MDKWSARDDPRGVAAFPIPARTRRQSGALPSSAKSDLPNCTMTESIQVRPATEADAQAVADIHAASALAAYAEVIPESHLNALAPEKRLHYWREAIEYGEPQVWLATVDGIPAGFVGFDRSRDPKTKATTGEIWAIYSLESYWDQGIGLALWDSARDGLIAEECTLVTVWVPLRNERAMRFFELAGFKRELPTARTTIVSGVKIEEIRLKRALS